MQHHRLSDISFYFYPILLSILVWPLHARILNVEDYSFPANVIGIFRSETSPPSTAALLAVENFNRENVPARSEQTVTYKHLSISSIQSLKDAEILTLVQNSIIVTGDFNVCEQLSRIVSDINGYLICYNTPTTETLRNLNSTSNLYLSQQNPEAFVSCLWKLMKILLNLRDDLEAASENFVFGHLNHSKSSEEASLLRVSILLDSDHPSALIREVLVNNLSKMKIRTTVNWIGASSSAFFSEVHRPAESLDESDFTVIIAALYDLQTRHLLCALHRGKFCARNTFLILLADAEEISSSNDWLGGEFGWEDYRSSSRNGINDCEADEILAAAEDHFLLEIPVWGSANKTKAKIISAQVELAMRQKMEPHRFDVGEVPLAYDSVWAMLHAVTSFNFSETGTHSGTLLRIAEELQIPFTGLSGELSFRRNRMRDGNNAEVVLSRFENGAYVNVGRRFNGTFHLDKHWLGNKDVDSWNSTWQAIDPECNSSASLKRERGVDDNDPGSSSTTLMMCLALVGFGLCVLILAYTAFVSARKYRQI